jgi:hypothetical protein
VTRSAAGRTRRDGRAASVASAPPSSPARGRAPRCAVGTPPRAGHARRVPPGSHRAWPHPRCLAATGATNARGRPASCPRRPHATAARSSPRLVRTRPARPASDAGRSANCRGAARRAGASSHRSIGRSRCPGPALPGPPRPSGRGWTGSPRTQDRCGEAGPAHRRNCLSCSAWLNWTTCGAGEVKTFIRLLGSLDGGCCHT